MDLLLPGQKPCAYFVIISAQDSAYRFLSSLFFSLALPRLSDYARLHGEDGRLPVLVNFCLDEYCNISYMDGIADALNSIRGFNMSCQIVVQSLSQWQEKYPGKEWENQLATFDQTLYMGCNDLTSAKYISEKCLDRRKCIALFQGHKPALLYKLAPEEFHDYSKLKTCRVIDYVPKWKQREDESSTQKEPAAKPTPPVPEQQRAEAPPSPEINPAEDLEYQVEAAAQTDNSNLGMVEFTVGGVCGEDDDNPPGR